MSHLPPIIVLGMQKGELKSPYDVSILPEKINNLRDYLIREQSLGRNYYEFRCSVDAYSKLKSLNNCKVIEIVGSWAQQCVAASVSHAINFNLDVKVPDNYIFYRSVIEKSLLESIIDYHRGPKFDYSFEENIHYFSLFKRVK